LGRVPAGNYVETIQRWADEYRRIFERPSDARPASGVATGAPAPAGADAPGADATAQGGGLIGRLIEYGYTLIGTPYVFGAKYKQISKGIDCSGYVCEVLEHCGLRLGDRNYLSAEAIRQKTQPIAEQDVRPGD